MYSPSIYGSESTDQKKEIEEEISKAVVYVYAFEVVLFENLWTRWSIRPTCKRHDTVQWDQSFSAHLHTIVENSKMLMCLKIIKTSRPLPRRIKMNR